MGDGEVQGDSPAHGQAADIGLVDAQVLEQQIQVLHHNVLGIGVGVFGNVRRGISPRSVSDYPVAAGKEVDL